MFIQMWLHAVGMVNTPTYGFWLSGEYAKAENIGMQRTGVFLVWATWIANHLICVVFLLNFLVTYVGYIYGLVNDAQVQYNYRTKAELNREYFQIGRFFGSNISFQVLAFSIDKDKIAEVDAGFSAQLGKIHDAVTNVVAPVRQEISDLRDELQSSLKKLHMSVLELSAGNDDK